MIVRRARTEDLPAVMNVLDGADLAVSPALVEEHLETDHVLVSESESGTVVGALVAVPRPSGAHVEGIAVRPRRRGQGVGSALLEAAAARWDRVTADFEPRLGEFYRSNGFLVTSTGDRYRGERV